MISKFKDISNEFILRVLLSRTPKERLTILRYNIRDVSEPDFSCERTGSAAVETYVVCMYV